MSIPERANREGDQALPAPGHADVFEDLVVHLRARQALGVKRYGRSLETFNGRDVSRDELEEFLDGWIYRWQARMERKEIERRLAEALAENADVKAENELLRERLKAMEERP